VITAKVDLRGKLGAPNRRARNSKLAANEQGGSASRRPQPESCGGLHKAFRAVALAAFSVLCVKSLSKPLPRLPH
jgi:hypothetical protein